MRYVTYAILCLLFAACAINLVLLGIDYTVARDSYLKAEKNGNFEQKIDGCIFQWVCDRYTKQLWK